MGLNAGDGMVGDTEDSPMSKWLSCVNSGEYSKDSIKKSVGGIIDEYNCCGVSGTTNSWGSSNSSDLEGLLNRPTLLIVISLCGVRRAPLNLICERVLVHMGRVIIFLKVKCYQNLNRIVIKIFFNKKLD